jgi:hypothetical protein
MEKSAKDMIEQFIEQKIWVVNKYIKRSLPSLVIILMQIVTFCIHQVDVC